MISKEKIIRGEKKRARTSLTNLDPQDLLPQILQIVEGGLGRDRVDQNEPLPVLHVQVSHRGKLLLQRE
jgi:hypothetical protein